MHSHQGQYILYYINHQSINPLTSINHLTSINDIINQTICINDNMIQQLGPFSKCLILLYTETQVHKYKKFPLSIAIMLFPYTQIVAKIL
jgi:hypothetical protein